MFKNHRNQQHANPFSSVQVFNLLGTLEYNEHSNNNNNKTNTKNNPPTLPFGM